MKKIILLSLLAVLCCSLFASPHVVFISTYTNGTDTITLLVSPVDKNMYAVVNGRNEIVLYAWGVSDAGPVWKNDQFGFFYFTSDYRFLQVHEFSSGQSFNFQLINVDQRVAQ